MSRRSIISEESLKIMPPIVNQLNFHGITEYIEDLLLDTAPEINDLGSRKKSHLRHIASITQSMPDHAPPILLE